MLCNTQQLTVKNTPRADVLLLLEEMTKPLRRLPRCRIWHIIVNQTPNEPLTAILKGGFLAQLVLNGRYLVGTWCVYC